MGEREQTRLQLLLTPLKRVQTPRHRFRHGAAGLQLAELQRVLHAPGERVRLDGAHHRAVGHAQRLSGLHGTDAVHQFPQRSQQLVVPDHRLVVAVHVAGPLAARAGPGLDPQFAIAFCQCALCSRWNAAFRANLHD